MDKELEKNLAYARNSIGLESSDAAGLASRVDAIVTTLTDSTTHAFEVIGNAIAQYRDYSSSQRNLLSLVSKTNYADLAPITIPKPVGLQVTYMEYLDNYLIPAAHFSKEVVSQLDAFTAFIGRLVNNKQDRMAINDMYQGTSALAEERYVEMSTINATRQSCFKEGAVEGDAKLETLVLNNNQWRSILDRTNQVDEILKKIPPKLVEAKVRKSVNYLKALRDEARRGNFTDVSPEMLLRLTDYIEANARSIELYAVIYHDALGFEEIIKECNTKISSIVEH